MSSEGRLASHCVLCLALPLTAPPGHLGLQTSQVTWHAITQIQRDRRLRAGFPQPPGLTRMTLVQKAV